jgi:hypothetical protein
MSVWDVLPIAGVYPIALWEMLGGGDSQILSFQGPHLAGGVIIVQRKGFPKLSDLIRARTPIEVEDRPKLLETQ